MSNNNEDKKKSIISTGSEIFGAAAGGVIGSLLGGPFGAVAGAAGGGAAGVAIAKTTSKVLSDVANRSLSQREEFRVNSVAFFAAEKFQKKLDAGEQPRNDGFFEPRQNASRSEAEEIFEGMLLKAKKDHEEKKIRYIGNIFTNAVFRSDLTGDELNYTLQLIEELTYQQMVILSLFNRKSEISVKLRSEIFTPAVSDALPIETRLISYQVCHLSMRGFLIQVKPRLSKIIETYDPVVKSPWFAPDHINPTDLCKRCYSITDLGEIPIEELEAIANCLRS